MKLLKLINQMQVQELFRVYKDGVVKTSWGVNNPYEIVGQYQLNQSSNNVQTNQTDNRNQ